MSSRNSLRLTLAMGAAGASFMAGGCASIVHNGNRTIEIASQPPARVPASIRKANTGEVVSVQSTPCIVSLEPKGGYFKGQSYTLKLDLAGYQSTEIPLKASLSGWTSEISSSAV